MLDRSERVAPRAQIPCRHEHQDAHSRCRIYDCNRFPRWPTYGVSLVSREESIYAGLGCTLMATKALDLAIVSARKQENGRDCTDEREQHVGLSVPGISLRTQELICSLSERQRCSP